MSDPKLLAITKEIQTRLEAIDGTGDYLTRAGAAVYRGRRALNPEDLPACSVFLGGRELADATIGRASMTATIVIEAVDKIADADHPEDQAIKMLADIQRAVETSDRTAGHKVMNQIQWVSDSIIYPPNASERVAARTTYAIPHVRRYGEPD